MLLASALFFTATFVATQPPESFGDDNSNEIDVTHRAFQAGRSGWRVVDFRSGGVSKVNRRTRGPDGRRGVLEQVLPELETSQHSTEVEILSRDTKLDPYSGLHPTRGGFGPVSELTKLRFWFYRDGESTTFPWLSAAVRVYVYDPDLGARGSSFVLVWEPVYNRYVPKPAPLVLPADTWIEATATQDVFWRYPMFIDGQHASRSFCRENPTECYVYNRTIFDWDFGPNAVIFGLSIAAGGGWGRSYTGYVDDVRLSFGDEKSYRWDFVSKRRHKKKGKRKNQGYSKH